MFLFMYKYCILGTMKYHTSTSLEKSTTVKLKSPLACFYLLQINSEDKRLRISLKVVQVLVP